MTLYTILDQTEEAGTVGIPGFWLTCLTSHPSISELITEEDVPALEHLTDITCAYDDNFTSFSLTFHFKENEFFTNTVSFKNILRTFLHSLQHITLQIYCTYILYIFFHFISLFHVFIPSRP